MSLFRRRLLYKKQLLIPSHIYITGPANINVETYQLYAYDNFNNILSNVQWSLTAGNASGTIDSNGLLTIYSGTDENIIVVQASYNNGEEILTATKQFTVSYKDNTSGETIPHEDGSITEIITEVDTETGTTTETTVIYDKNGDPTEQETQITDADNNVSTQVIEYNENGDPVVTEYTIDTSDSSTGGKVFNGDGVNTEYYAFDLTHGFELGLTFTINFNDQPANQQENHHNVLTMKRATPEPWYGFQIRHTGTNKNITLGTQFETGSNVNTTVVPLSTVNNISSYDFKIIYDPTVSTDTFIAMNGNTVIYTSNKLFPDLQELRYLKVTLGYAMDQNGDPYRFSNINVSNFYIKKLHNVADPVISCTDGKNITITCDTHDASIYYRLNEAGSYIEYTTPIRIYQDTVVQAYSQLITESGTEKSNTIKETCIYDSGIDLPDIDTVNNAIVLSCDTVGAIIYYRLNQLGNYLVYTEPIDIEEDTFIETYAELNGEHTIVISATCLYDNGIETPVISCNGEIVTIGCNQADAEIYYRLNETGEFSIYTSAIEIFEDTVVEAYVKVGNTIGHTAKETCKYEPILLATPVIIGNGPAVIITCATQGAAIYYKLNNTGNYTLYTSQIPIFEDTFVQAYSTIKGKISAIVSETCIYSDVHDYSLDYLTFRILTDGKIFWRANGSLAKTIEYSLNNGSWTSITAATPTEISVLTDDVIRFRGTNASYATSKTAYSGFGQGEAGTSGQATYDNNAAEFNIEGNIMSLVWGDNFIDNFEFNGGTYNFCSIFKKAKCISAENLILPAPTLTQYCYRAMFSWCTYLETPPALPATTLAKGVYWYLFEKCAITTAPDLLAEHLVAECYGSMFTGCASLNFIKCMAIDGFSTTNCKQNWVTGVASSGTFVKDSGVTVNQWSRGNSGIPTSWLVYDDVPVVPPTITYDGFSTITLACETQGATIYYKLTGDTDFTAYTNPLTIASDTVVQTYSELNGAESRVITSTCVYVSDVPIEASNRDLKKWQYSGQEITTPYSVNGVDGHTASYSKGTFNFETSFALRQAQPTYLWFQHADQSAIIYIDNVQVTKHWGGYTAFTVDISNYVHSGQNNVKVTLKNNEGNSLAPANADFNFNATLGNVKLFTSPCLPGTQYGYDGFHVYSTVTAASATINIKTTVPTGASVYCSISDGTYSWSDTIVSDGTEMTFTNTITNPHLWNGKLDPHLYTITMEISKDGILYHRFVRPYGFRYYSYVINDTTILQSGEPYTGFLLNGSPYLLRGCCMHDDIAGKANALDDTDYNNTFATIQELNCNFLRLAHYPHPKEVYDRCDQLGIIVQTEGPCVNKMQSTMPTDYFDHLEIQYRDMVQQHKNHPCIIFWGLSNETQVDDKDFAKTKAEAYSAIIKGIHPEAWVGYVVAQSATNPSAHYNNPNLDWFGCNIYVGWYASPNSNNPSSELNKRVSNTITALGKILAYSEYGCGGTPTCHSDDPLTTTTRGNHERHDIEYQMWLHEGQIAAIKNYPQLAFTAQWQLFDIAVANRNEGYTECLDGETTSINDDLRRLNNKGLVERDHIHKKDTFYLYKAWWNPTPFVHICGKNYTKTIDRVIKCYTNETGTFTLYVNNVAVTTATASNNIVEFTAQTFSNGNIIRVDGPGVDPVSDTFTFDF